MSHGELTAPEAEKNLDAFKELLGGKLYPIDDELQTDIREKIKEVDNHRPPKKTKKDQKKSKRDQNKPISLRASNAIYLAEWLKLDEKVAELNSSAEDLEAYLGKRRPAKRDPGSSLPKSKTISSEKSRTMYHFLMLGRELQRSVTKFYLKEFLELNQDSPRINVTYCLPEEFGQMSDLRIDLEMTTAFHRQLNLSDAGTEDIRFPVEIKVMSSDLFKWKVTRDEQPVKAPQPPQQNIVPDDELDFLDGLVEEKERLSEVKELLVQRGLLSKSGELLLSHSWVFQAMIYALSNLNTSRLGQLAILAPQGLYVHTFQVSAEQCDKIKTFLDHLRTAISSYERKNSHFKLGGKLYPLDTTFKQEVSEAVRHIVTPAKQRTNIPAWIEESEQSRTNKFANKIGSELSKQAKECGLTADIGALNSCWDRPIETIGRKKPSSRITFNLGSVSPTSKQNSDLLSLLKSIFKRFYEREFLVQDFAEGSIQTNLNVDSKNILGTSSNFEFPLLARCDQLKFSESMGQDFKASHLPVEIRSNSHSLFKYFLNQDNQSSKRKPDSEAALEVVMRELLVEDEIIFECGRLNVSHKWVLQSILSAMAQQTNTDKVGQLAINTLYGVYIHTFLVPLAMDQKLREIITKIRRKQGWPEPTNPERSAIAEFCAPVENGSLENNPTENRLEYNASVKNVLSQDSPAESRLVGNAPNQNLQHAPDIQVANAPALQEVSTEELSQLIQKITAHPEMLANLSKILLPHLIKEVERELRAGTFSIFGFRFVSDEKP